MGHMQTWSKDALFSHVPVTICQTRCGHAVLASEVAQALAALVSLLNLFAPRRKT